MQIVVVMNLYIDPIKTFIVLNVCNLRILNVVAIFALGGSANSDDFGKGSAALVRFMRCPQYQRYRQTVNCSGCPAGSHCIGAVQTSVRVTAIP